MLYKEYQLGFVLQYIVGYEYVRDTEQSPLWFFLFSSIPVMEKIGLDVTTQLILNDLGLDLDDLSQAYNKICAVNCEDMLNMSSYPHKEYTMIIYHDKAALSAYKKWRQAWHVWRESKTNEHNRRARRYESAFKRHVVSMALKEHLNLDDEQSKRFTYRLDGRNMRVYHRARFVGLAYIWPNIEDTGTTKVSFMLASEVYNEYWPT